VYNHVKYQYNKKKTFIQQGSIKLMKSDNKDIYNVTKDNFSNLIIVPSKILNVKILSITTVF